MDFNDTLGKKEEEEEEEDLHVWNRQMFSAPNQDTKSQS